MELRIDGLNITAKPGQSLLELVRLLGLDSTTLSQRPLAAKIAGEVFTLNYIPLRQKDAEGERNSIRRAMAASGGVVNLDVILDVPVELDNQYQSQIGYIGWEFKIEEMPIEPTDPEAPETGDRMKPGLWCAAAVGSAAALLVIFRRRKRDEAKN